MTPAGAGALALAVLASLAQVGDAVRVRASICRDTDCTRTSQVAFEPALVRVTYAVAIHRDNRALTFGLACSNGAEYTSTWQLDGEAERIPQWTVKYPGVMAGECQALAVLLRADGSRRTARSETLLVQSAR